MRKLSIYVGMLCVASLLVAASTRSATLEEGSYASVSHVAVYQYFDWGETLRATGYFYNTPPGHYGPFSVSDGQYHSYTERSASVPMRTFSEPSDSLIMPVSFGMTVGEPIAYMQIGWATDYDPIQMRLEFWRTRSNGQQELVWFQPKGGPKYGSVGVLYDTNLEGLCFFKVAVAPPGGFSDLSPPDITIQSPRQYDRFYKHDDEQIPIRFVVKDYGSGNADVSVTLDDQPFVGMMGYTEHPDNVLEAASEIDVASLENGQHTLKVSAHDYAGNTGTQSVTFTLQHLDGAIVGWGNYYYNQSIQPPGLDDVVAISAGGTHSLALRADGTVVGWGANNRGQATPPQGLADITAVSAGSQHSLALTSDGIVVAWGADYSGASTPPYGLTNVVSISAGTDYSLALRLDGTVVGWGANYRGQATPPQDLANVVAISAGFSHSMGLRSDGTVVYWGNNNFGQVTVPPGLKDVVAISAGTWQSLALKSDGTVVGWGSNLNGEAVPPSGLTNVVAISAGEQYSLALRDITAPSIGVQSPVDGQTYFNTDGPIPLSFTIQDDFDLQPEVTLTLDGEPFSSSEIAVSDLPFGNHTLMVTAQDRFGNTSTRAAAFKVVPQPMLFAVNELRIDWRKDAERPKADRLRVFGEFSLPNGYTPSRLSQEVVVLIEVGGHHGTDTVLGKLKIEWNKRLDQYNRFKLDSELSVGVFNDDSGIVTVTMLIPVVSGGDLAGTETVTCNRYKHCWEYHK